MRAANSSRCSRVSPIPTSWSCSNCGRTRPRLTPTPNCRRSGRLCRRGCGSAPASARTIPTTVPAERGRPVRTLRLGAGPAPNHLSCQHPRRDQRAGAAGAGPAQRAMTKVARDTVVFDLGGVLIDWDPRHLYRKLFAGDEAAIEHFLATVCTLEWHRHHDTGRSFAEGARLLKAEHPDKAELIDGFARQDEMIAGQVDDAVAILQ